MKLIAMPLCFQPAFSIFFPTQSTFPITSTYNPKPKSPQQTSKSLNKHRNGHRPLQIQAASPNALRKVHKSDHAPNPYCWYRHWWDPQISMRMLPQNPCTIVTGSEIGFGGGDGHRTGCWALVAGEKMI